MNEGIRKIEGYEATVQRVGQQRSTGTITCRKDLKSLKQDGINTSLLWEDGVRLVRIYRVSYVASRAAIGTYRDCIGYCFNGRYYPRPTWTKMKRDWVTKHKPVPTIRSAEEIEAESRRFFNWLHGWYCDTSLEDHNCWKVLFDNHYGEPEADRLRGELSTHGSACIDGMSAAWSLTGYHAICNKKGE